MIFLIAILPLAVYLLILAMINRRPRALMVSGSWDFLGVIFALSGFVGLGGPAILTSLNEQARHFWILGRKDGPMIMQDDHYTLWLMIFIAYFLIVVLGSGYLLWRRRAVTVIYNVDHDVFGEVLGDLLMRHSIEHQQSGNVLFLKRTIGSEFAETERTVVEVEPAPKFRHITIRWDPVDSPLRQDIERELQSDLSEVEAPRNPAGDWLLVVSGLLFLAWIVGIGILAVFWFATP